MGTPVNVPLDEVQGIILRGYALLESARFVLLEITDPDAARRWLGQLELTSARHRPTEHAVNVAFTHAGLARLGLPQLCLDGFAREFVEGMDTDHRQRILGDIESRSPQTWAWGNRDDAPREHVLLLVYADTPARLDDLFRVQADRYAAAGLQVRAAFDPLHLRGRKEHFGFRDGIAQPHVAGVQKESPTDTREPRVPANTIPAGEILLGYANAYDELPPSPVLPTGGGTTVDFGANGSYLVVRQLKQDVKAFWNFLSKVTARDGQSELDHHHARLVLASKMVGRWPSGAPLARSPDKDDPLLLDEDEFLFAETDALGRITPLGSHTRRTNPRDSLEPGPGGEGRLSAEVSLDVTRLHRIIRRGRPYGPPVAASMDPRDIVNAPAPDPAVERGLLFLCFNANIARQFEFIQQTWINNPKFAGLYEDTDPLMGPRDPAEMGRPAATFTEQRDPLRRRVTGLPDFVTVRGGGYFFMPGIRAVRELADYRPATHSALPMKV
jgi:Dyp-type peroxidase family